MIRFLFTSFFIFQTIILYTQNYNVELVNQQISISIKKGKLQKEVTNEIKIYNRSGEKYTKIRIPYSKMNKIYNIDAFIKDKNGRVIKKLKKSDISDRSAISNISFYEDHYIKEFTLKHNSYPYSIVYSYQVQKEEFLYVDYWLPVLNERIPTLKAKLIIEVPLDYKIRYSNQFIDSFSIDSLETFKRYTWETSYKELIKAEIFSPPMLKFFPRAIIVPEKFKYELVGSFDSWLSYGNWQHELIKNLSELPQSEKNRILSTISGIENEKEKVKQLFYYLQDETRYINISIETGGLKPYSASYVAENKYGDCKALTNYFKSVLEFVGIQSYYTKVYSGEPINKIDKILPSQQFNHVILCVPIKNDTLWIDCTSDGPFNYLGTFTQNRDVFIIERNNSHFVRTPALTPNDVLETRKVKFYLNQQKDAMVNVNNTYKGDSYESLFYVLNDLSESKKNQVIKNYYIEDGMDVDDFDLVNSEKDSSKIQLLYVAKSNKVYNQYGNEIIVNILPFSISKFEEKTDRKLPIQLDYPMYKIDTLEYLIPNGYFLSNVLENHTLQSEFGEYKIEYYQNKNIIKVVKSILVYSGFYSNEKYKSFYDFIKRINEIEHNSSILTKKQN